jgi:Na+-translocating ferredoxin:NAD+ oxidoreductase subunit E
VNHIRRGIFKENPIFVIMLGLCPTLAITTEVINGIGMGLAILVVLVGSNLFISLLRAWVPDTIRIPVFIVIIASFVTIVDLLMQALLPNLAQALGIFIPLIVVNCIILGRAESFASKNPPLPSVLDAIGMSIGFTLSLLLLAGIRELLGNGTLTLQILDIGTTIHIPFFEEHKAAIMILPPGAFLTLGLLMGFFNHIRKRMVGSPNAYTLSDQHISSKRQFFCNGGKAERRKA